jgi:outer membrane biosynthesis protein TonB
MRLVKEISKKTVAESRSAFNTLLLSGLIASSFLVGCSSVGQKTGENAEPVASTAAEQNNTTATKAVVKKSLEKKQENAAALMATLSAPIEEPGGQQPMVKEPVAKKSMAQQPEMTKPVAKEKAVETKVAEVKKEVVPVVEVKAVEKVVVEAPKEVAKVVSKPAVKKIEPAKSVTKSNKTLNANPLNIRLKDLPVTYDIWQFKQGVAALEKGVVVSTPTWEMGKESYNSQIWVTIMENQILINSSSDINTSAGNLGIKINDGALIPFTRIEANNIGVIEGQWLDQLQEGGKMDIFLGFFPGKIPLSDVFKTDVSLDSLSRVVPTYRNLLK